MQQVIQRQYQIFPAESVQIVLDKNYYWAGSNITGHVYMNITYPTPGNVLMLKLKGKETTKFETEQYIATINQQNAHQYNHLQQYNEIYLVSNDPSDSDDYENQIHQKDLKIEFRQPGMGRTFRRGDQIYKIIKSVGGRELVKEQVILNSFQGGMIMQGQYCFPFALATNFQWPGSYYFKQNEAKGFIRYELKVECGSEHTALKHKIPIRICQRPQQIDQQIRENLATNCTCCCLPKGKTKMKVQFDKNAYFIGETAKLICECDNTSSKAAINSINVNIVHKQRFIAHDGNVKTIHNIIKTQSLGGLEAGGSCMNNQARQQNIDIQVTNDQQCTSNGQYIISEYNLQVTCDMDLCCKCCGDIPQVGNMVLIYPTPIETPQFQFPPNWAPQQFPVTNFAVGGVNVDPNNPYNKEPDNMRPPGGNNQAPGVPGGMNQHPAPYNQNQGMQNNQNQQYNKDDDMMPPPPI